MPRPKTFLLNTHLCLAKIQKSPNQTNKHQKIVKRIVNVRFKFYESVSNPYTFFYKLSYPLNELTVYTAKNCTRINVTNWFTSLVQHIRNCLSGLLLPGLPFSFALPENMALQAKNRAVISGFSLCLPNLKRNFKQCHIINFLQT